MTIIKQFFSKIFDRLFPELQEGDIVCYRGRKQRVIESWYEMSLDNDYNIKKTPAILLSCHGKLLVTTNNRLLIRKLGHEPIPTFKIGDQVRLKEVDSHEWYWNGLGVRTSFPNKRLSDLLRQVGTIVRIDSHHLISNNYSKPTMHVRFDEEGYEITLYPCFLDTVPDYDII